MLEVERNPSFLCTLEVETASRGRAILAVRYAILLELEDKGNRASIMSSIAISPAIAAKERHPGAVAESGS